MQIQLKNIKYHPGMSRGTPAYTADLWVNGVKTAHCRNSGDGGSDVVHPHQGFTQQDLQKVHEHFRSLPKVKKWGMLLSQSFELWCHDRVLEQDSLKLLKRKMKQNLLYVISGKVCMTPKDKPDPSKGHVVLNDIPQEEAEKIWLAYCAAEEEQV